MAAHHSCSSASSLPPDRRGRLRDGATPGDFLAAPRCGAHTRSGEPCRQPAMRNGRCRMHGGLSTGRRTAEGRARCAAARRTHGFYSADMVALRRAGTAYCRRMDALFASLKIRRTAGHGGAPAEFAQRHRRGDPCAIGRRPIVTTWSPDSRRAATRGRPYCHRWAWAPSTESVEPPKRQHRYLAGKHDDSRSLGLLRVSASPRATFQRRPRALRWAWGAPVTFRTPAGQRPPVPRALPKPRHCPARPPRRHRPRPRCHGQAARPRPWGNGYPCQRLPRSASTRGNEAGPLVKPRAWH